jgi:PhnB protein
MAGDYTIQMNPYLSFKGDCEAAFTLYVRCLGGRLGTLFRYGATPMADQVPADWSDKIMHASLMVGDQVMMGGDVAPDLYEEPKGFSMSLHTGSASDVERIFRELASGGRVVMPLEKTFWAARFGMLVDRFGITWLINCDGDQNVDAKAANS